MELLMVIRVIVIFFSIITATTFLNAVGNGEEPDSTANGDWDSEVIGGFTLTQAHFDNWEQGGENTLAWQVNFDSEFIYRSVRHKWSNTGMFKYGQARLGELGTRKSADEIRIESVYQYTIGAHVNPFSSATFQTQSARGYRYTPDTTYAVSDFMDPGYITLSAGAGSNPFEGFNTRLGAAFKMTIVNQYARHITDGERIVTEFGITSVSNLRHRLTENLRLTSRLELFSKLNRIDDIDVRWEMIISAKVTAHIDVRLSTELFYDKSVSSKRQLKQMLAVGFSYTLL